MLIVNLYKKLFFLFILSFLILPKDVFGSPFETNEGINEGINEIDFRLGHETGHDISVADRGHYHQCLTASTCSHQPLKNAQLRQIIRDFDPYDPDLKKADLPEGVTFKAENLSFALESIVTDANKNKRLSRKKSDKKSKSGASFLNRETEISILSHEDFGDTEVSSPCEASELATSELPTVGKVVLRESLCGNLDGQFSLHLIEIDEAYKGKGFGSTALDMVILLAKQLAKQSDFYQTLTLQCSDYDEHGRSLGDVPYRLSYYLNHGFSLDDRTKNFMRHLDKSYFFSMMTTEKFTKFLEDYSGGGYSEVDVNLVPFQPYAAEILDMLRQQSPFLNLYCDENVLSIAESDSSKAAQRILDRLYYDMTLTDNEYQDTAGNSIYILRLPLAKWSERLESRQESKQAIFGMRKFNPHEIDEILVSINGIGTLMVSGFDQTPLALSTEISMPNPSTEAENRIPLNVKKEDRKRKRSSPKLKEKLHPYPVRSHRKSAKLGLGATAHTDMTNMS